MGVSDRTIKRWEADRKAIMANPELAAMDMSSPEKYKLLKKELYKLKRKERESSASAQAKQAKRLDCAIDAAKYLITNKDVAGVAIALEKAYPGQSLQELCSFFLGSGGDT
jgi:hypothetical protein